MQEVITATCLPMSLPATSGAPGTAHHAARLQTLGFLGFLGYLSSVPWAFGGFEIPGAAAGLMALSVPATGIVLMAFALVLILALQHADRELLRTGRVKAAYALAATPVALAFSPLWIGTALLVKAFIQSA